VTPHRGENASALTAGVCAAMSVVSIVSIVALAGPVRADEEFALEFFIGSAANFKTPLEIEQAGRPDIDFSARYATKPFEQPIYWVLRFDWMRERSRWELQLIHHKLYLENNPAEVQHFEITHGYNLLTANRAMATAHFTWRVGAGAVIAHTESVVRGLQESDKGHQLAGPVFLGGVGRSFDLSGRLLLTAEIQLSLAWAKVSVADGFASGPNVAFHFIFGGGFRF
jgi:hypothetical protein